MTGDRPRALVMVLGDLARSPRMLRHAQSLAGMGCDVDVVGYPGAALPTDISTDSRIHIRPLPSFERLRGARPATFLMSAVIRQLALAVALLFRLVCLPRPGIILLQNPPALPALPIALLFARIWRARMLVDWHNLTSAMLRLRPAGGLVVRVVQTIEVSMARLATAHLSVSQAMTEHLQSRFAIRAILLPDFAPRTFLPIAEREPGARATIVVPTSWGADEDFALLAEAVRLCDEACLPLHFLITGDGESRAAMERRFADLSLRHVAIETRWFHPDDYPRTLASAGGRRRAPRDIPL